MPEYDSMLSNSINAKFRSWSSEYYNICVKYDSARENQSSENATKLFFSSRENETSYNYSELDNSLQSCNPKVLVPPFFVSSAPPRPQVPPY